MNWQPFMNKVYSEYKPECSYHWCLSRLLIPGLTRVQTIALGLIENSGSSACDVLSRREASSRSELVPQTAHGLL